MVLSTRDWAGPQEHPNQLRGLEAKKTRETSEWKRTIHASQGGNLLQGDQKGIYMGSYERATLLHKDLLSICSCQDPPLGAGGRAPVQGSELSEEQCSLGLLGVLQHECSC